MAYVPTVCPYMQLWLRDLLRRERMSISGVELVL